MSLNFLSCFICPNKLGDLTPITKAMPKNKKISTFQGPKTLTTLNQQSIHYQIVDNPIYLLHDNFMETLLTVQNMVGNNRCHLPIF